LTPFNLSRTTQHALLGERQKRVLVDIVSGAGGGGGGGTRTDRATAGGGNCISIRRCASALSVHDDSAASTERNLSITSPPLS